jgi:hypothetical protein
MKRKIIYLVFITMTGISRVGFCQGSISGPTCVLTGISYQYDLKPKWDGTGEMELCLSGGIIENASSNCIKTTSISYIRVIWNEGIDKGSLYYTYGTVKDSITVFITTPLLPGSPEADKKIQKLSGDAAPQQISCSLPTGGNCSPDYKYQWQQSGDGENWEDINEGKSQHLSFESRPAKTTLYRRKTMENKSGAIAYTEVSMVVLQPADVKGWNQ